MDIIPIAVSALELFEKNTKIDLTNIDIVDDFKTCMAQKIVLLGSIWKVLRENSSKDTYSRKIIRFFKSRILNT